MNQYWIDLHALCINNTNYQIEELSDISGLSIEEIKDLIDNGVIVPAECREHIYIFHEESIQLVKTARRLRDDFQLDQYGLSLALTLLRKIHNLEVQLKAIEAKTGYLELIYENE